MGKWQNTWKHHTQKSQEVSPFPAGNHKAARNRQESMADMKHKSKKDPAKMLLIEILVHLKQQKQQQQQQHKLLV